MKAYILAKDQYAEPIKNVVADLKEMGFEIIASKPITRPKTPSVIPTWVQLLLETERKNIEDCEILVLDSKNLSRMEVNLFIGMYIGCGKQRASIIIPEDEALQGKADMLREINGSDQEDSHRKFLMDSTVTDDPCNRLAFNYLLEYAVRAANIESVSINDSVSLRDDDFQILAGFCFERNVELHINMTPPGNEQVNQFIKMIAK